MGRKTHPRVQRAKGQAAIIALRLLGALPFAINRALATAVGTLLAWLPTQALKVSKTNLALCYPALSAEEQTRLARKSLLESVKNTFEIALFWRQPAEGLKRVVAVDGDTPLRQAVQDGRPIMILAPHLGCWEVLNFWLATEF
ncbi:MAG TPA: lipid A biosynthesis acyltransferase, partial [Alcanivorax sp.]|nr:lipid A biosynthesis acyltransferase [Alcanivorax sp.]